MSSASQADSICDNESAPIGKHSLTTRTTRKTVQKICPSAAAVLTLALCCMGAPYSAYGQAELPTPTVTLTSSPNPSNLGESVTFTATVSSPSGQTPQGSITISEYPLNSPPNSPPIIYGKPTTLTNGVAAVPTDALTAGAHLIWVTYGGEPGVYQGAQQQVSQIVKEGNNNQDSAEPLKTVIPVHLDASAGGITVGSKVYPGANPGMHLLAFSRQPDFKHLDAPDLIKDETFHDASSANQFLENILAANKDAFLIVNAAGNYGFALNAIAKNLEKFGARQDIEKIAVAVSFIFLGNGGRNMGQALQRGDSTGNVDGYLAADSNGNYTFIQTDYIRYDITTDGTITIGDKTYTVAGSNRQPGCNGSNAFHLVVVNRENPEDPGGVVANDSYCTAQSPNTEIAHFQKDLESGLGNEGLLFFIASSGNPIPLDWNFYNCTNPPATCQAGDGDARIQRLANDMAKLGGYFETMVYLTDKDKYSLVGASAPPAGTPGASNRAQESSSVYPDSPTGELHGVLARGLREDWYSPLDADRTTGLANLGLYQILAQTPVPFPHPANQLELNAFNYISNQLCEGCSNVRNLYTNTLAPISSYENKLSGLTDPAPNGAACPNQNPTTPFCIVRAQLLTEFEYVQTIRNFYTNVTLLWLGSGSIDSLELLSTFNTLTAALTPKPEAPAPNAVEPVVSFLLGLGSEVPVVGRIFGIADTAFRFAMSMTNDEQGNEQISLTSTAGTVAQQAANQFKAQGDTTGTQFDFIFQDWGKIQVLGPLLANALPGSPWYWGGSGTAQILSAMQPAIEESYYRSLMSAVYAIGKYVPQCSLCLDYPNNVNWGGQPLWKQPRSYTVNDPDCGVCGNAGLHKAEPFALNHPPYTFPTDSTNPYQDPSNSDYTQGTATLLTSGSWLAAAPQADPADGGYYGLYDPGRTLVKILPHLFTPRSEGGLGVYRPAFFESWPFPHITCGWSDNGSGDPGPGCNWGSAAPSPDAVPGPVNNISVGPGVSNEKLAGKDQIQVPFAITNNGTQEIQSIQIDDVSLRTLAGSGQAVLADPLLPIKLGSLAPGNSATLNVIITVPPGVQKLAVTGQGTASHGEVEPPAQFSFGQTVSPGKEQ